MQIRLIRHEAIPKCGSYEIRFPDGRASRFIYWDDIPGRRLRSDLVDSAVAERVAKIFALRGTANARFAIAPLLAFRFRFIT